MTKDEEIARLKGILSKIEFIQYEDPEEGLLIFCPVCGQSPEPEKLSREQRLATAHHPKGKGHDKNCELARALNS